MNTRFLSLILLVLTTSMIFQGCSSDDPVLISGQIIEQSSDNAILGALVDITDPAELSDKTIKSDSSGNFSLGIDVNETTTITLEVSKPEYQTITRNYKITPDSDVNNLVIRLSSTKSSGGNGGNGNGEGNNGNDDVVGGESGEPTSLELVSISKSAIAIRATGGDEESKFTFAVKDSAGRPVNQGYEVHFSLIEGPGGGARINPSTGITNSEGMVSSAVASGDLAGVVKIQAEVERPDVNKTIRSTPVLVAIGNGFTEADNFRIAPVHRNFEAFGLIASPQSNVGANYIVASLGDYRNNPVLPGTAVDFTTTGGIITASAVTDDKGIAIAEIRPNGSTPTGNSKGIGFATVTARTVDIKDNYITATTDILLTTQDPIIQLSPVPFNISADGSESFTLTVTDLNGNPIAAGSNIKVSVDAKLSHNFTNGAIGDYVTPGPGRTEFGFTVSDTDEDNSEVNNTSITVTVTLPSGANKSVSFEGKRAKVR